MAWWEALFSRAAGLPTAPFALVAAFAGIFVAYAGWSAGRRAGPENRLAA
jgi:hypothetical protein